MENIAFIIFTIKKYIKLKKNQLIHLAILRSERGKLLQAIKLENTAFIFLLLKI